MIDYAHSPDGLTCNANVTEEGGKVEAIWTFDRHGELATDVHPVPDEAFRLLWDGIAASLNGGGVFWTCLVADPTRLIDPDAYHVVATVQVSDGRLQHRTFMVPVAHADLTFTTWLALLTATAQPQHGAVELDVGPKELAAV